MRIRHTPGLSAGTVVRQSPIVLLAMAVQLVVYAAAIGALTVGFWALGELPEGKQDIPFWPTFGLLLAGVSMFIMALDRYWMPAWSHMDWFRSRIAKSLQKRLGHAGVRIAGHLCAMALGVYLALPLFRG
jgi:hypothetical protein